MKVALNENAEIHQNLRVPLQLQEAADDEDMNVSQNNRSREHM